MVRLLIEKSKATALALTWALMVTLAPHAGASDVTVARLQTAEIPRELVSDKGSFTLRIATTPSPIPLNDMFDILVEVTAKHTVNDPNPFWLSADAMMPDHNHGMNTQPRIEDLGNGKFAVRGLLFHMSGEWEILFDVAKGKVREQVHTDVYLD